MDNKMRNIVFNILMISYILFTSANNQQNPCSPESYHVGNWTFENDTLPPVNITVVQNGSEIMVGFPKNRSNYFHLTVFGNPFISSKSECPPLNTTDPNLRKWYRKCNINKDESYNHIQYLKIFRGCFYFVVTNKEEKHWVYGPEFYNTTYQYINTRVTLKKYEFKPELEDRRNSLNIELNVPLDCIPVRVRLFEYKINHNDAMKHIEKGALKETQLCWISMVMKDGNVKSNCTMVSDITLQVQRGSDVDRTTRYLTWHNLTPGGANYYFHYSNYDLDECKNQYDDSDLESWILVDGRNYVKFGEWYGSNEPKERKPDDEFPWLLTISSIVSFIIIMIILYGIHKWYKLRRLIRDRDGKPGVIEEPMPATFAEIESDKILLIYVQDCLLFKSSLNAFKILLEKHCSGYKIKDIYAENEWSDVVSIGATQWVEQQLKSGSKVVWVDTPQFRSRLNDKEKGKIWNDFRDEAAPHAVDVARTLFQNANTQYCRHFVVRMKGFEVDDRQEDPLKMFTPYVRYHIPDHSYLLCKHLKGPMERLIKKENFYAVIKLDSSSKNYETERKV